MAAGGFKEFVAGEILDEDDINDYLLQGVLVFAGTAARGSAITAPVEGQFAFLKDTDALTFYDGSDWVEFEPGAPTMTGGTVVTGTVGSDTYQYHIFKSAGTATVSSDGRVDILLVAGGGGGGNSDTSSDTGGAGGGGGVTIFTGVTLPVGTFDVAVGAGGPGGFSAAAGGANGTSGGDSYFGIQANPSFFVRGGGYGAQKNQAGFDGGSGGSNGSNSASAAPLGTFGMGFNAGARSANNASGGGGGAGGVGSPAVSTTGGAGGIGREVKSFIPASLATSQSIGQVSGSDVYFGGGGGGGGDVAGGAGGLGGGTNGTTGATAASDASANTGGGGGGSETGGGGDGGSGLVIVRYKI